MQVLSVIIPVYNVKDYLTECIESVVKQTYKEIEIIIVDDGSTDGSGKLADELALKFGDKRKFVIIHKENGGLPSARNAGINVANGQLIGFVDSDDYICPDMYEKMVQKMETDCCDLVICNFCSFNYRGDKILSERYCDNKINYSYNQEFDFWKCALDSVWNKVYKAEILRKEKIFFESKKLVPQEDYYFLVRYIAYCNTIGTLCNAYYQYRQRKSSISRSKQDDTFTKDCLRFIDLTQEYYTSHLNRDVSVLLYYEIHNLLLACINNINPVTIKNLKNTINLFKKNCNYKEALKRKNTKAFVKGNSLRAIYTRLVCDLLELDCDLIVSILETMRINLLRVRKGSDLYFE